MGDQNAHTTKPSVCRQPTALPSSPLRAAREGGGTFGLSAMHGPTEPYCADLDGSIGPAPRPNGSVGNYQRGPALAIARLRGKRTCGSLRQMEPLSFCLGLSFSGQLPQETTCYPNCPDADKPRCLFATGSSHFHGSVLNCIRSADRSASKYSRNWFPEDQLFHFIALIETAPGVHPA